MPENRVPSEDYISFSSVRRFAAGCFRTIYSLLAICKSALRRSWLLLLVGIAAGGLLGWLYHYVRGSNYRVDMIVNYTDLNKRAINDILEQLATQLRADSRSNLASELKIPYSQAQEIRSIVGRSINDESLMKDTTNARLFMIVVGLSAPVGTDTLEEALINYLNDLPYIKTLKAVKARVYEEQLAFINREQGKLDTLKSEYVRSLSSFRTPSSFYNNAFDPASIYRQSYVLDSLKSAITLQLNAESKFVSTVAGFKPAESPSGVSGFVSVVAFMLLGVVLVFISRLFAEINRTLNGS